MPPSGRLRDASGSCFPQSPRGRQCDREASRRRSCSQVRNSSSFPGTMREAFGNSCASQQQHSISRHESPRQTSGSLRNAVGSCYPPQAQQESYASELHRQSEMNRRIEDPHGNAASGNLHRPRETNNSGHEKPLIRGATLAAMVEEPTAYIDGFLSRDPDCSQVRDVLCQYQAFVYELAMLAQDLSPHEQDWRCSISPQAKQVAQQKFNSLRTGQPRMMPILNAYRDAVKKLERVLRRQTDCTSQQRESRGFLDVGRIVSSGIEMLFGDSSKSKAAPPPQTYGWTTEITPQKNSPCDALPPEPQQGFEEPCDNQASARRVPEHQRGSGLPSNLRSSRDCTPESHVNIECTPEPQLTKESRPTCEPNFSTEHASGRRHTKDRTMESPLNAEDMPEPHRTRNGTLYSHFNTEHAPEPQSSKQHRRTFESTFSPQRKSEPLCTRDSTMETFFNIDYRPTPETRHIRDSVPQQHLDTVCTPKTQLSRESIPQQHLNTAYTPEARHSRDSVPQQHLDTVCTPKTRHIRDSVPQQHLNTVYTPEERHSREFVPQQHLNTECTPKTRHIRNSVPQQHMNTVYTPEARYIRDSVPQQHLNTVCTPEARHSRDSVPQQHLNTVYTPKARHMRDSVPQQHLNTVCTPEARHSRESIPEQHLNTVCTPEARHSRASVPQQHLNTACTPEARYSVGGIPEQHLNAQYTPSPRRSTECTLEWPRHGNQRVMEPQGSIDFTTVPRHNKKSAGKPKCGAANIPDPWTNTRKTSDRPCLPPDLPCGSRAEREARRQAIESDQVTSTSECLDTEEVLDCPATEEVLVCPITEEVLDCPATEEVLVRPITEEVLDCPATENTVVPPLDLSAVMSSMTDSPPSQSNLMFALGCDSEAAGDLSSEEVSPPIVSPNVRGSVRHPSGLCPPLHRVPSDTSLSESISPNDTGPATTIDRSLLKQQDTRKANCVRDYGEKARSQPTTPKRSFDDSPKSKSAPPSCHVSDHKGERLFKPSNANLFSGNVEQKLGNKRTKSADSSASDDLQLETVVPAQTGLKAVPSDRSHWGPRNEGVQVTRSLLCGGESGRWRDGEKSIETRKSCSSVTGTSFHTARAAPETSSQMQAMSGQAMAHVNDNSEAVPVEDADVTYDGTSSPTNKIHVKMIGDVSMTQDDMSGNVDITQDVISRDLDITTDVISRESEMTEDAFTFDRTANQDDTLESRDTIQSDMSGIGSGMSTIAEMSQEMSGSVNDTQTLETLVNQFNNAVYEPDSFGESSDDRTDLQFPNSNNSRGKAVYRARPHTEEEKTAAYSESVRGQSMRGSSDYQVNCVSTPGTRMSNETEHELRYQALTKANRQNRAQCGQEGSASSEGFRSANPKARSPPCAARGAPAMQPPSSRKELSPVHQKGGDMISPAARENYRKMAEQNELLKRELKRKDEEVYEPICNHTDSAFHQKFYKQI